MEGRLRWDEWFCPSVGSTMDWARQLAAEEDRRRVPVDALRVRTGRQLTGRGRRGSPWWDSPGASMLTTLAVRRGGVWDPRDRNPASMALRAGLAVSLALEVFHVPGVAIKWPNDIYVEGTKVCGILVEADPRWFYVGIGLNIRDPAIPAGARDERMIAAPGGVESLLPESAGVHSVTHMIDRKLMETLTARDWAERVRPRLVWTGQPVSLLMDTSSDVTGVLAGIDEDGALLIFDSLNGRRERYLSGTLRPVNYS